MAISDISIDTSLSTLTERVAKLAVVVNEFDSSLAISLRALADHCAEREDSPLVSVLQDVALERAKRFRSHADLDVQLSILGQAIAEDGGLSSEHELTRIKTLAGRIERTLNGNKDLLRENLLSAEAAPSTTASSWSSELSLPSD